MKKKKQNKNEKDEQKKVKWKLHIRGIKKGCEQMSDDCVIRKKRDK